MRAPVSGTVYLNGKPLANALVQFQPIGTRENPNPGRGSFGATDANGKFTLRYDGEKDGAVVGNHRVAITTMINKQKVEIDPDKGSPDGVDPAQKPGPEKIPARYNDKTTLTFEVPRGGTDKADFRLETP